MSITLLLSLAACGTDFNSFDTQAEPQVGEAPRALDLDAARPYATDRVIVGFHEAPGDRLSLRGGEAVQVQRFSTVNAAVFALPAGVEISDAIEDLRASGQYDYVEPDYIREIAGVNVNDEYAQYQWNMDAVGALDAWDWGTGDGVIVAVIDTGVSEGPLDGIGGMVDGWDFVNESAYADDDNGHGTHVAGTIAQATNNGAGVIGLAPDALIMPVKVMSASGIGYTSDIIAGIEFAVEHGAHVINMSIGSTSASSAEEAAVGAAWDAGVMVVAATGNDGDDAVNYPAGYAKAVAVGATDGDDIVTSYSNIGDVTLVAPGGDLSGDADGDGYPDGILQETFSGSSWSYYFFEGTSMASPHVAAAGALLMGAGANNNEAIGALIDSAVDVGIDGWDASAGYGRIDAAAAMSLYHEESEAGPKIVNINTRLVSENLWRVSWLTETPANSQVCFTAIDRCNNEHSDLVNHHRMLLRARAGSEIVVISTDERGNISTSEIVSLIDGVPASLE